MLCAVRYALYTSLGARGAVGGLLQGSGRHSRSSQPLIISLYALMPYLALFI